MTPRPPSPFPAITRFSVPSGTALHRIHASIYAADGFNPCRGRPTRFAPLIRPDGTCIPTAYAATNLQCAAYETIFHDIPPDAAFKTIPVAQIEDLHHSTVSPSRDLIVCGLFQPDLNRWRITRGDLIDTCATAYLHTALWAIAIHDSCPDVDGLVWTSRRCDPDPAYLLFGDRVQAGGRLDLRTTTAMGPASSLLDELRTYGRRGGISFSI